MNEYEDIKLFNKISEQNVLSVDPLDHHIIKIFSRCSKKLIQVLVCKLDNGEMHHKLSFHQQIYFHQGSDT
ncbi:hypothetical protein BpHYR1_019433 [Brachionus plicatilis]|uniref:Uncharacterized protein n=1 Tax=Brachionus plicatilis TaxID=10195 RepID=A0A3M7PEX8_BRAPC|nr:hypothetical protein BpHYR1_019433 [Brachionus plicatilis]